MRTNGGAARPTAHGPVRRRRANLRTGALYAWAILREFRWTLAATALAVAIAATLYAITPHEALGGRRPSISIALFGGWFALFAEPILSPPETWYLVLVATTYPVLGFVLVGEGVVRLALLMLSRERGEKEWMRVMASTYRDHVVLCGLGHLGSRVLERLVDAGVPVVVIEKEPDSRFVSRARHLRVPLLLRDMKDDDALVDAGVPHARAIIVATNDDLANVEVALDARRMNPAIRIAMRMFDQAVAGKLAGPLQIDAAFSSSSLAAPAVAAMALDLRVLATFEIDGVPHVAAELEIAAGSPLVGLEIAEVEARYPTRIVAVRGSRPSAGHVLAAGDPLVVHAAADELLALAQAGRATP